MSASVTVPFLVIMIWVTFICSPVELKSNFITVMFFVPVWFTFDALLMPVIVMLPKTATDGFAATTVKLPPFNPRTLKSNVFTRASAGADQFSTFIVADPPADTVSSFGGSARVQVIMSLATDLFHSAFVVGQTISPATGSAKFAS